MKEKEKPKNTAKKTKKPKKTNKRVAASNKLSSTIKPAGLTLVQWQLALRRQMAATERFGISSPCPGEYAVNNTLTRQCYKVVYRGANSEWNYCSCMDFKTSLLGTCKHIEAVRNWISGNRRQRVCKELPAYTSVYLSYKNGREVKIRIGSDHQEEYRQWAERYFDRQGVMLPSAYERFGDLLVEANRIDNSFRFYQDAVDYILEVREHDLRVRILEDYSDREIDGLIHNATLYPYQREGVRFAFEKGKAVIADEMGLGKTIQAIATAELLRREHLVDSVLILCPTSLKYQWSREIERFTHSKAHVIEGHHLSRVKQYRCEAPYKIISYNSACNDIKALGSLETDMLIMDEVQRLKNWDTQISKAARRIRSKYSVILSGTPLENKLEELYSVMEFVDQYCLSPYYQFKTDYIKMDDNGKVIGYRKLNQIGERIRQRLIRRTKKQVALQMPARQDKNLFVPMTPQQQAMHEDWQFKVSLIVQKWNNTHFISEAERLRLLKLLSQMRMVCDSTYIIDQQSRYDTKVEETMNILRDIFESGDDEKVVIFSQWERMTRLIAGELDKRGIGYENLNGMVPSKKRKEIIDNFTDDPSCRVFLSTDAGSTGLNLQVASTLINLDLPWNPAVLEQRIARIYRLGQENPVQIINLVAHETFEEQMLGKLRFKTAMFEGVLDNGEDTIFIGDKSKLNAMMENLNEMMGATTNETAEEVAEENGEDLMAEQANLSKEQTSDETLDLPSDDNSYELALPFETNNAEQEKKEEQEGKTPADIPLSPETGHPVPSPEETPTPSGQSSSPSGQSSSPSGGSSASASMNALQAPESPQALVQQGMSFLSGLAKTLQSPEATAHLVDTLVETNDKGESTLRIPVADKQTVKNLLNLVGKLFG